MLLMYSDESAFEFEADPIDIYYIYAANHHCIEHILFNLR